MATQKVTIYRTPLDGYAPDSTRIGEGLLTDEHAASSYGQPILVVAGRAYGPGDLPATDWLAVLDDWDISSQEFIKFPADPEIFVAWQRAQRAARQEG